MSKEIGQAMVSRTEINRIKALIQPIYGPAYVICMCGSGIVGFNLTHFHWHWPTFLVALIGVPVSFIIGLILTGLITISIGLFKDRKHNG